jgi:hypothetical protein
MSFNFNNHNIIGDYVPVSLEKYRPNYGLQYYAYNVYGYNNLYSNQNYRVQNQNQYQKAIQPTDPNKPTKEKKTPDEPPDEGPMYLFY